MGFSTKYTISNKLLFNIKEVTKVSCDLNNKRLSHVSYSEIFEKTKKRGVSLLSLNSDEGEKYAGALGNFSKKNQNFDLNLITSIHSAVVEGGGKFKNNQAKKTLKDLIKYVQGARKDTDSLIISGLFYKHFETISPFEKGSRKVNVLATRILIMDLGVNVSNLFNMESIGEVKTKDNTKWLEHFTQSLLDEMVRVKKELGKVTFKPDQDLNEDQKKILKYLEKHSVITDVEYSTFTERKKATRVLDFNKLIERDLIERCGKGRQTHYILK